MRRLLAPAYFVVCFSVALAAAMPGEPEAVPVGTPEPTERPVEAPTATWSPPPTATPFLALTERQGWYVAGIVAGESANTLECYLVTACNVLWDIEAGRSVDELLPGRWYGWQKPAEVHVGAVEFALHEGCLYVPRCIFLGNETDLELFIERGWAEDAEYPSWTDKWGMTSVCVTED